MRSGVRGIVAVSAKWEAQTFKTAVALADRAELSLSPGPSDWGGLRDFLVLKREFILGLLQNPNLLEHEEFTDLLWAVCHLTEELSARADFAALPETDVKHLVGDLRRAYGLLIREWLTYMQHLQTDYPYIYSLYLRMNPFSPAASPMVSS